MKRDPVVLVHIYHGHPLPGVLHIDMCGYGIPRRAHVATPIATYEEYEVTLHMPHLLGSVVTDESTVRCITPSRFHQLVQKLFLFMNSLGIHKLCIDLLSRPGDEKIVGALFKAISGFPDTDVSRLKRHTT